MFSLFSLGIFSVPQQLGPLRPRHFVSLGADPSTLMAFLGVRLYGAGLAIFLLLMGNKPGDSTFRSATAFGDLKEVFTRKRRHISQ